MDKNPESETTPDAARIDIVDAPESCPVEELRSFAGEVLALCGAAGDVELAIAFIDDAEMARLNNEYRGAQGPTDVLSFPIDSDTPEGRHYLGDVAISLDTAERQAAERGHSMQTEVLTLAAHGIIHLCGHDHESDDGEMARIEDRVRRELVPRYC